MQITKKTQLAYRIKRKKSMLNIPELALQKQCNDTLDAYRIRYIYIPDNIHRWITMNAPEEIKIFFRKVFGGIPDNVCFIPIGDKYNLCLCLELKSAKGHLHGKQKHWEKELAVQISRDPDKTIETIKEFIKDADKEKRKNE